MSSSPPDGSSRVVGGTAQDKDVQPTINVWTCVLEGELSRAAVPAACRSSQEVWHCQSIIVDSTGVGREGYSFLRSTLGSRVTPSPWCPPALADLKSQGTPKHTGENPKREAIGKLLTEAL